jgi:putative tributyrin esterase
MGGFGALRLAAKYPQRFVATAGLSSITRFEEMSRFVEEPLSSYHVRDEDRSVLDTILRHRGQLPAIRFDCGISDPLIEGNRALHRALEQAGVGHIYAEYPGAHEWAYWIAHLPDALSFFGDVLRRH